MEGSSDVDSKSGQAGQIKRRRSLIHQYFDEIIRGLQILDGSQEGWGDIYAAFIYCRGVNIALEYYVLNVKAYGSETITKSTLIKTGRL